MGGEPARSSASGAGRGRSREAALPAGVCAVFGVLNVTPDSFSDGGRYLDPDAAFARALALLDEGADVIDVGGESSRPPGATYGAGAARVPPAEEVARVVPVIERLRERGARVSVDTVKGEVARAALAAGASLVNDVSAGADPTLLEAVAEAGAELILMHTRGRGAVDAETTAYDDLVGDVIGELEEAVERAVARGVPRERIWIDPGIGFAKTAAQSVRLLGNLDRFVATGYPVLVGASRKSFIARVMVEAGAAEPPPGARLGGSLAAVAAAARAGCRAVRVHDVLASVQAARVTEAMVR